MSTAENQIITRQEGDWINGKAAVVQLFGGTLGYYNATGFIDDNTGNGLNKFAGVVRCEVDNSLGSAGDLDVSLWNKGIFEFDGTGFTQADEGEVVYGLDNFTVSLDPGTSGVAIGTVKEFVSSTRIAIEIMPAGAGGGSKPLEVLSRTFSFGDMSDGGGTSGFIDFLASLPVGAHVMGWSADVTVGFTGDTTAVVQVGVSGDVNKFSANTTKSVLAVAKVGSHALAVDGVVDSAAAPRVTVTGTADFTSISAGTMTMSVYYYPL